MEDYETEDFSPDCKLIVEETLKQMIPSNKPSEHFRPRNLYEISQQHTILLIFRRFVSFGGCAFCNRRMVELMEFYRSLVQLNIVPIIVYPEDEERGEEFFNGWTVPEVSSLIRVADPNNEFATVFDIYSGNVSKKVILTYLIPQLLLTKRDGFSQERKKRSEYHGKSFYIRPAMFLCQKGKVIHSWRMNYADHCPKILDDIVLKLDLKPQIVCNVDSVNEQVKEENEIIVSKDENERNEEIEIEEEKDVATVQKNAQTESKQDFYIQEESMPMIDTSRTIPIYKRKEASSTLEVITPNEKHENEKKQTMKAMKSLQPKYSCFGNRSTGNDSGLDVLQVLNTTKYRKYFKLFAHMEFNIENILFWEEVNTHFRPIASFSKFEKTKQIATSIGNLFLFDSHSVMHVNTSDKLRDQVKEQIQLHFESKNILESIPKKETRTMSVEDSDQTSTDGDNYSQLSIADRFNDSVLSIFDPVINEMLSSSIQDMFIRFKMSNLFIQMMK